MPINDKKGEVPLQKFRPPRPSQRLSELLKPDVLDEETRQQIVRNAMCPSARRPSQEGNHPSQLRDRVSGGNADLLGAMAQRLKTLEAQQRAYRLELQEKSTLLARAEEEYKSEKARREEVEAMLLELYDERKEMERALKEMREFLADYGMKWVGEGEKKKKINIREADPTQEGAPSEGKKDPPFDLYAGNYNLKTPEPPATPVPSPRHVESEAVTSAESPRKGRSSVDMELLKRNARILSDHVGQKGVISEGKHGGIQQRTVVTIVVYKNGICVNGGIFRPFGWPLCDAVLCDLTEGYYPYEFKDKFPDGFPIEIVDHSTVSFKPNAVVGNVGGAGSNVKGLHEMQAAGQQPVSRAEFLKRLPQTRITANGRIVQVRNDVAGMVVGGVEVGTVKHVSAAEARYREVCETNDTAEVLPQRIKGLVAVMVRFPAGEKLTLHMEPENTVEDLRREIRAAMPSFTSEYELRVAYPAATLKDHTKTLRESGIVTSCTLMIQLRTTERT